MSENIENTENNLNNSEEQINTKRWTGVSEYVNGTYLDEDTLNVPIKQLTARTDYLYNLLKSLRNPRSSVIYTNVNLDNGIAEGDVVYLDASQNVYRKAQASSSLINLFSTSGSSYPVGVVSKKEQEKGDVVAYGLINLPADFNFKIEGDDKPISGNYYLSAVEPGKLTLEPSNPEIFIGTYVEFEDNKYIIVSPDKPNLNHKHFTRKLAAKPAGEQIITNLNSLGNPTINSVHKIVGYSPIMPEGEDPKFRIRILGEWNTSKDISYSISISKKEVQDSNTHSHTLDWVESGPDGIKKGDIGVSEYYTKLDVGSYGMVISVEPYETDGIDSLTLPDCAVHSWSLLMPDDGKGWRSSDIVIDSGEPLVAVTANGAELVLYGSLPNNEFTEIVGYIPTSFQLVRIGTEIEETSSLLGAKFESGDLFKYQLIDDKTQPETGYEGIVIGSSVSDTLKNVANTIGFSSNGFIDTYTVYLDSDSTTTATLIISPDITVTFAPTPADVSRDISLVYNTTDNLGIMLFTNNYETLDGNVLWFPSDEGVKSITSKSNDSVYYMTVKDHSKLESSDFWKFDLRKFQNGCAFTYAIGMDLPLRKVFPPVPVDCCEIVINGVSQLQDVFAISKDRYDFKIVGDTIAWRSNSYAKVPWDPNYVPSTTPNSNNNVSVLFTMERFTLGNSGPVTSLRPAPGSNVRILDCGTGEAASVGDLMIDIDLLASVEDSNYAGYKAVKTSRNGKLVTGPLVERIIPGPGIYIQRYKDYPKGQGVVILSSQDVYGGDFEEVALENAKQEKIGMFPYIKLLGWNDDNTNNIPSSFVSKFTVPSTVDPEGKYRVNVYATVFGEHSIPADAINAYVAGIEMSYNILPDYNPLDSNIVTDRYVEYNLVNNFIQSVKPVKGKILFGRKGDNDRYVYTGFDPILIHNNTSFVAPNGMDSSFSQQNILGISFPTKNTSTNYNGDTGSGIDYLKPGYIVAVRFSRTSSDAGRYQYTGGIGFINLRWELIRVA
jgi:hypothetical protein